MCTGNRTYLSICCGAFFSFVHIFEFSMIHYHKQRVFLTFNVNFLRFPYICFLWHIFHDVHQTNSPAAVHYFVEYFLKDVPAIQ